MINLKAYNYRGPAINTSFEVWRMHTEAHEDIILEHIDGSLDEKNVSEALRLLRQCDECKRIYVKSLVLRSKLQPAHILNYLETKSKPPTRVAEKPRRALWSAWLWRPLAAAIVLLLAAAFPLIWYVERLQTEFKEKERAQLAEKEETRAELAKMRDENQRLKEKIQSSEVAEKAGDNTNAGLMASAKPAARDFWNVSDAELRLLEVRGQTEQPSDSAIKVVFSKNADLWHMLITISEEKSYPRYGFVILDSHGRTVKQKYGIRKDTNGNFNVYFEPPNALKDKEEYLVKIYGLARSKSPELVTEQRIRIFLTP